MSLLEKIQSCRASIKASNTPKAGYNSYSKYYYFTPEQIDAIVHQVCAANKIFCKFDLNRNELGIYGLLTIYDLETSESIVYTMASAIPEITATNDTQKLGGAVTYTKRYALQMAFDIVDNNLDPDSQDRPINEPANNKAAVSQDDKPWLNESDVKFAKIKEAIRSGKRNINDLRKVYKISHRIAELLEVKTNTSTVGG